MVRGVSKSLAFLFSGSQVYRTIISLIVALTIYENHHGGTIKDIVYTILFVLTAGIFYIGECIKERKM